MVLSLSEIFLPAFKKAYEGPNFKVSWLAERNELTCVHLMILWHDKWSPTDSCHNLRNRHHHMLMYSYSFFMPERSILSTYIFNCKKMGAFVSLAF